MDKLAELIGFLLVVGFLYFVWPPLVLLGAGVSLILYANTRESTGRVGHVMGSAWKAARLASAETRAAKLKAVA